MQFTRSLVFAAAIGLAAPLASAHHGKDFLVVESYDVPHPGNAYLVSSVAIATLGGQTAVEFEPSLLVGLLPRLAFELHAHTGKEPGEPFRYEATAPALHFQLTPPHSDFPVRIGVSAEYEFAATDEENDRIEERLVLERSFGKSRVALNVIGEHERHGESSLGYAVGYRYEATDNFSVGAEIEGPVTTRGVHEFLVGTYVEPNERLTLKVGVGPTFDSESKRTEFIARFAAVIGL